MGYESKITSDDPEIKLRVTALELAIESARTFPNQDTIAIADEFFRFLKKGKPRKPRAAKASVPQTEMPPVEASVN